MTKSLMISIQPKHLVNILNGNKTLELRKTVPKDFKGWVYIYVSRGKDRLSVVHDDEICKTYYYLNSTWGRELNGEVFARFWFDEYIAYKYYKDDNSYFAKRPQDFGYGAEEVLKRLCLSRDEFKAYGKGKDLYAWHIKKLEIFDKPKELGEFYKSKITDLLSVSKVKSAYIQLDKAPQSWQFVYTKEELK